MKQTLNRVEKLDVYCCSGDYWAAKDVCNILEIEDADQVIADLDPDLKAEYTYVKENKKIDAVNRKGLFTLMLQSQTPIAKRFKKWLLGDVLNSVLSWDSDTIRINCDIRFSMKLQLDQYCLCSS